MQDRWIGLDLLRGASIAGMFLNLLPGDWGLRYSWLDHAKWNGVTAIDMVAPAFLFCVGASISLSFERRLAAAPDRAGLVPGILRRCLLLILIGLLIGGMPAFDIAHWRLPGVLQRIGLAYALASLICLALAQRREEGGYRLRAGPLVGIAAAILIAYGLLLTLVPPPGFDQPRLDPLGAWPSVIDRAAFGAAHLWEYGTGADGTVVYDPDGLLSTLPVLFNILAGAVASLFYRRLPLAVLAQFCLITGAVFIAAALLLSPALPINKSLWTSSFALFSTGVSLISLAVLTLATRPLVQSRLAAPLQIFGTNPLLAFVLCWSIFPWLDVIKIGGQPLRGWGQTLFSAVAPPAEASFLFSLAASSILFLPLLFCHRRGYFWKL